MACMSNGHVNIVLTSDHVKVAKKRKRIVLMAVPFLYCCGSVWVICCLVFSSWCINGCDTLCPPWLLCGHDSAYSNVREYFGLFKLQVGVDVVDADRPCLANGSMPVCRPCLSWLPAAACVRDRPMTTTAHI